MKQFECFWGDGYRDASNKSILEYHDEGFFNNFRGYEDEHIYKIQDLEIGDVADLTEMTGQHWVRRMS